MERTAVRSRDLAVVGYDNEKETLEVAFRSGGVYHYFKVPDNVYQELLQAPSMGIYFRDKIRDHYEYNKVSG